MTNPMLKAFMQSLSLGRTYTYAEISDRMAGFVEGWNAGVAHAQKEQAQTATRYEAKPRRKWTDAQRKKFARTIAKKKSSK